MGAAWVTGAMRLAVPPTPTAPSRSTPRTRSATSPASTSTSSSPTPLGCETQWDGATIVDLSREDFEVKGRHYKGNASSGGAIRGDFFGFLSGTTTKLVSIAANTLDPRVRATVTPELYPDRLRGQVDLTPVYQSMLMSSTDVLRIVSQDGDAGTREITIIVNELSEAEAVGP